MMCVARSLPGLRFLNSRRVLTRREPISRDGTGNLSNETHVRNKGRSKPFAAWSLLAVPVVPVGLKVVVPRPSAGSRSRAYPTCWRRGRAAGSHRYFAVQAKDVFSRQWRFVEVGEGHALLWPAT